MNFDTKYLIRWGIPGWVMIIVLVPYLFVIYHNDFDSIDVASAGSIIASGAILTILGVPLGYLLNQIHHSLFWVIPKCRNKGWEKYFKHEIKLDEYFYSDKYGEEKRERYRYILTRKHELGGMSVSLGVCCLVICIFSFRQSEWWSWLYFIIVFILFIIILISRNYSHKNVVAFEDKYLHK